MVPLHAHQCLITCMEMQRIVAHQYAAKQIKTPVSWSCYVDQLQNEFHALNAQSC